MDAIDACGNQRSADAKRRHLERLFPLVGNQQACDRDLGLQRAANGAVGKSSLQSQFLLSP
jgi:hypothetical protein